MNICYRITTNVCCSIQLRRVTCCAGEITQSYTLGRIGEERVVTVKLPLLYANEEATSAHGDFVAKFLGQLIFFFI